MFEHWQWALRVDRVVRAVREVMLARTVARDLARRFAHVRDALARVAVLVAEPGEFVEPAESLAVLADEPDNRNLECVMASGTQVVAPGTVRCWRSASTEVLPSSP